MTVRRKPGVESQVTGIESGVKQPIETYLPKGRKAAEREWSDAKRGFAYSGSGSTRMASVEDLGEKWRAEFGVKYQGRDGMVRITVREGWAIVDPKLLGAGTDAVLHSTTPSELDEKIVRMAKVALAEKERIEEKAKGIWGKPE